jgi:hypothetical protein
MNYSLFVNSVFGGHHLKGGNGSGSSPVLTWTSMEAASAALTARGFLNSTDARTSSRAPKSAYVIEAPFGSTIATELQS